MLKHTGVEQINSLTKRCTHLISFAGNTQKHVKVLRGVFLAELLLLYYCIITALLLLYCCFTAALLLLCCCFTASLLLLYLQALHRLSNTKSSKPPDTSSSASGHTPSSDVVTDVLLLKSRPVWVKFASDGDKNTFIHTVARLKSESEIVGLME